MSPLRILCVISLVLEILCRQPESIWNPAGPKQKGLICTAKSGFLEIRIFLGVRIGLFCYSPARFGWNYQAFWNSHTHTHTQPGCIKKMCFTHRAGRRPHRKSSMPTPKTAWTFSKNATSHLNWSLSNGPARFGCGPGPFYYGPARFMCEIFMGFGVEKPISTPEIRQFPHRNLAGLYQKGPNSTPKSGRGL